MKKILCVILALVLMLSLAACGGPAKGSPEAAIATLMEGIKAYDPAKIQSVMKEKVDESDLSLEGIPESMLKTLKEWSSKLTYKTDKSTQDGNTCTVPVDVTYTDASDIMKTAMADYISKAMAATFSGGEVKEEEMSKLLINCIEEAAKNGKTTTANSKFDIKLEKVENEWKITEVPADMMNVMTSNLFKSVTDVLGGLFGE